MRVGKCVIRCFFTASSGIFSCLLGIMRALERATKGKKSLGNPVKICFKIRKINVKSYYEFFFVFGVLKSANFYHLPVILLRGQDYPRQCMKGTITSICTLEVKIKVRFHWGEQVMLGAVAASNK